MSADQPLQLFFDTPADADTSERADGPFDEAGRTRRNVGCSGHAAVTARLKAIPSETSMKR